MELKQHRHIFSTFFTCGSQIAIQSKATDVGKGRIRRGTSIMKNRLIETHRGAVFVGVSAVCPHGGEKVAADTLESECTFRDGWI